MKDAKIICSMMNRKAGYEKFRVIPSLCGCGSDDIVEIEYERKSHEQEKETSLYEEPESKPAEVVKTEETALIPEAVTKKSRRRTKKTEE